MNSLNGITIDERYELLSQLGSGGMGAVYKARQLSFDREVAVKLLGDIGDDAEARARFEREAMAISALKHRNIVMFYGYGVWRGAPYMVMEYVNGVPLQDLLKNNKPLDPMHSLRIAEQVAEALEHAHANGIVHRDLKPGNIMIVGDHKSFSVKIIDFGLARLLPSFGKDVQKLTEAGNAVGSVLYMSPEQCTGGATDARSDIYGLGCILHHCLTGAQPFLGDHSVVVMQRHLVEQLPRLDTILPDNRIPAGMQALLDRATAKDPGNRYQTAQQMLDDIRVLLANDKSGITVLEECSSHLKKRDIQKAVDETVKMEKRKGKPNVALLCALVAVLAGSLTAWYLFSQAPGPRVARTSAALTSNPNAAFSAAEHLAHDGKEPEALALLIKVLAEDRSNHLLSEINRAKAYLLLTTLQMSKNQLEAARQTAKEGLASCPHLLNEKSLYADALARIYLSLCSGTNHIDDAMSFCKQMAESQSACAAHGKSTWIVKYTMLLAEKHQYIEARNYMLKALPTITTPRDRVEALVTLAGFYDPAVSLVEARKCLAEAEAIVREHDLEDMHTRSWLANLHIALGEYQPAEELLTPLLGNPREAPAAWAPLALCAAKRGDFQAARNLMEKTYQRSLAVTTDDFFLYEKSFLTYINNMIILLKQEHHEVESEFYQQMKVRLIKEYEERYGAH